MRVTKPPPVQESPTSQNGYNPLRYRDQSGNSLADIVDLLTLNPEGRRGLVQLLNELSAQEGLSCCPGRRRNREHAVESVIAHPSRGLLT